jgi:uncharacterized protein
MSETALISVHGTGRVQVHPELARLRLGCIVENEGAVGAFDSCSTATAAVIAALRDTGAGEDDISTSGIQLSKRHQGPYVAENDFTVTVRPPESAGEVLAVAIGAGGDALTINGIEFDVADDTAARSEARSMAVRDAHDKAEELASAAGLRLGRLVSLDEGGGMGGPVRFSRRAISAGAASAPVEVGDKEVSVSVSAVFEIAEATPT